MNEIKFYDLNPSQEVVLLQTKYTLFKRVINILFSATFDKKINLKLMEKAFNKVVERNDCLRIKFVKKDKKLMQCFQPSVPYFNIPVVSFNTQEEQERFINKKRKKAIKYKKGVIIEPYFVNTYDNKQMLFIKVCHYVLDIYGINKILQDLFDVYDAMDQGKELPPMPTSFEEIVKRDLENKKNEEKFQQQYDFFYNKLVERPEPFYAGIHGPNNPIWQKQLKKGQRGMKMFFVRNDTLGYEKLIPAETMQKVVATCKDKGVTLTDFMFYACILTASKINGNVKNLLPLQLCNCRGNAMEKACAGTKVQSLGRYTTLNYNNTFSQEMKDFNREQMQLYRRLNFSDMAFEMMLHQLYRSSMMETYYMMSFSFIPYKKTEGVTFDIHTNGKGALICYLALLYNVEDGEVRMCYDVQKKLISEKDVNNFHATYIKILSQLADNPEILIKDVQI